MLIGGNNIFKGIYLRHQEGDFRTVVLEIYILAHTGTKLFCLADINNRARFIFPKIYTRLGWNTFELFLDLLEFILIHLKTLKAILPNQEASTTRYRAYPSPAHALDCLMHRSLELPQVRDGGHDAESHRCSR